MNRSDAPPLGTWARVRHAAPCPDPRVELHIHRLFSGSVHDMITVANRLFVDPAFAEQFEARFRERAGLVDRMPGFISNQVLRPVNPGDPYVVLTWWESREDFKAWTESEEFRQGHARSGTLPKEAFTGPNKLEIHEVFLDSSRPDLKAEPPGGPMKFH